MSLVHRHVRPASSEASPPLAELRAALPRLGRGEIRDLLEKLHRDAERDLSRAEGFRRRKAELLGRIAQAEECAVLRRAHDELNRLEMENFLEYRSVPALHAGCTAYRDALAGRALELVTAELIEAPPLPFALISMGSDGRGEQTLMTDQDYLLVYGDPAPGDDKAEADFAGFAELLVERLEEIGFARCTGGIMPVTPRWRGSLTQWLRRMLGMVRYESEDYAKNVMDLIILSDARYVAGDRDLADALIEKIRILEREYFQALWGMAKAATEMQVALTFLKRIWTESSGPHKGEFNVKLLGWAPLVMNVRILAISEGIAETGTLERIEALRKSGSLTPDMADGLAGAYHTLAGHRVLKQIEVLRGLRPEPYHLAPAEMGDEERETLRRALLVVEGLQKMIRTNFLVM